MISPERQRLDEALTAAGHDDNCGAFEGGPCSGPPVCDGEPVPGASSVVTQLRPHSAAPAGPMVTLTGAAALAYAEYQAAARELKAAQDLHRRATERFTKAHQAFADAAADG